MKQKVKGTMMAILDSFPSFFVKKSGIDGQKFYVQSLRLAVILPTKFIYYGVKISVAVNETGFSLAYVVNSPEIHDVQLL